MTNNINDYHNRECKPVGQTFKFTDSNWAKGKNWMDADSDAWTHVPMTMGVAAADSLRRMNVELREGMGKIVREITADRLAELKV